MTTNQIGRELIRRLVDNKGCDLQVAIRFFYNSSLYEQIVDSEPESLDSLYSQFESEFASV